MSETLRARNLIEEHFARPKNVGEITDADGVGIAGSATDCGDVVKIFIKVTGDRLSRVKFKTVGCPAAIASSSMTTELASGCTLDGAAMITGASVEDALGGLPPGKRLCSNLGADALQAAIEDFISRDTFEATRAVDSRRVAVAMSGGVDSSTAAAALKLEGYDVIGLTMRLYDSTNDPASKSCCSSADITDARSVASQNGFPHFSADFRGDFRKNVIDRFCSEYLSGKTPNPCMECNRQIKFKNLIDKAQKLGAGHIATGHYVNIGWNKDIGRYVVRKSADIDKDQSYMFWSASQEVLSKLLMPLGRHTKSETRKLAEKLNLAVADKRESQEICFIPDNNYHDFLEKYANYKPRPGSIVNTAGQKLGTHRGLPFYTIGQRHGLGIAHTEPYYVLAIHPEKNTLVVGEKGGFNTKVVTASEANFIPFDWLSAPLNVEVMYRYNMNPLEATIKPLGDHRVQVDFAKPQGGVAPGQSIVFYDGDMVIGGGIIDSS